MMKRGQYLPLLIALARLFIVGQCYHQNNELKVIHEWKTVDYEWPSEEAREEAIEKQEYIPLNVVIWDVNVFFPRKEEQKSCAEVEKIIFVNSPRIKSGVPATLSTVSKRTRNGSRLLKPYPSWAFNREGNCGGLTSVYRTCFDECGRIWILDQGNVEDFSGKPRQICSPQIVLLDVWSGGELVGRYPIPERVLGCTVYLITIIVDTRNGECDASFAYIADPVSSRLIVFNLRTKTFSRVAHNTMYPYPQHGDFDVAGVKFQYMDAITGLSLDQKAFLENERSHQQSFFSFAKKKVSQSVAVAMTDEGVMFFSLISQNAVGCWNSQRDPKMGSTPMIAQNNTTMQFISGMKVFGSQLFAVSGRLQNYYFGSVSAEEVNYRILFGCVPHLTQGTACESKSEKPVHE